jgi:hypothetical protein
VERSGNDNSGYNSNNTAPSIGTIAKRNITTGLFGLLWIENGILIGEDMAFEEDGSIFEIKCC